MANCRASPRSPFLCSQLPSAPALPRACTPQRQPTTNGCLTRVQEALTSSWDQAWCHPCPRALRDQVESGSFLLHTASPATLRLQALPQHTAWAPRPPLPGNLAGDSTLSRMKKQDARRKGKTEAGPQFPKTVLASDWLSPSGPCFALCSLLGSVGTQRPRGSPAGPRPVPQPLMLSYPWSSWSRRPAWAGPGQRPPRPG